jgi:hypothetical protein
MQEVRSVQEIRKQLDDILNRARNDEAFGKRLNSDPEATLREAGFHSRAIGEVSEEIKQFVQGKRTQAEYEQIRPNLRCDYTTCWVSWCNYWTTFGTMS